MIERIKYPRTPHLPWSLSVTNDDKVLHDLSAFEGQQVVITQKMDGESITGYSDGYVHARSIDSRSGPDRDWCKNFLTNHVSYNLPHDWRICGENLFAKHSIAYSDLPSFFMGISIWDHDNNCISWADTEEWFKLLNVTSVPVLFKGTFNEKDMLKFHEYIKLDLVAQEGYVVRLADKFHYANFGKSVAKFGRQDHVQTDKHWRLQAIIPNKMREL